jgi:hypothetical protein
VVKFDARTKVPIEKTKVEIERLVNLRGDRSDASDLQCLSSPHHKLVEPRLGGPDDFRVHRLDQPVDRWILDGLEDSVRITGQQVLQHGEGRLASLDYRLKRDHRLRHDRSQFVRGGLGLVMSAMTNLDIPARSRTVSVKPFVSGLSKLSTMGKYSRSFCNLG